MSMVVTTTEGTNVAPEDTTPKKVRTIILSSN